MQNRYVGDIGDYGKYALLRSLTRDTALKLGVVWYLFGDETHNGDGRHISYFGRPESRTLDPELFDRLAKIIQGGQRSIHHVAGGNILPKRTVFFEKSLTPEPPSRNGKDRLDFRKCWLDEALAKTLSCDLVFLDPDNGMETKSVSPSGIKSGKYIFWSELKRFWERDQSLVVYHHLNRTMSVARQTKMLKRQFAKMFPDAGMIMPLLFRRGSCRHFWVVGQKRHANFLEKNIDVMIASTGQRFFEIL